MIFDVQQAFYGYANNSIIYDTKKKTWAIINKTLRLNEFLNLEEEYEYLGLMKTNSHDFVLPTGLNEWNLTIPNHPSVVKKLMFTKASFIHRDLSFVIVKIMISPFSVSMKSFHVTMVYVCQFLKDAMEYMIVQIKVMKMIVKQL